MHHLALKVVVCPQCRRGLIRVSPVFQNVVYPGFRERFNALITDRLSEEFGVTASSRVLPVERAKIF